MVNYTIENYKRGQCFYTKMKVTDKVYYPEFHQVVEKGIREQDFYIWGELLNTVVPDGDCVPLQEQYNIVFSKSLRYKFLGEQFYNECCEKFEFVKPFSFPKSTILNWSYIIKNTLPSLSLLDSSSRFKELLKVVQPFIKLYSKIGEWFFNSMLKCYDTDPKRYIYFMCFVNPQNHTARTMRDWGRLVVELTTTFDSIHYTDINQLYYHVIIKHMTQSEIGTKFINAMRHYYTLTPTCYPLFKEKYLSKNPHFIFSNKCASLLIFNNLLCSNIDEQYNVVFGTKLYYVKAYEDFAQKFTSAYPDIQLPNYIKSNFFTSDWYTNLGKMLVANKSLSLLEKYRLLFE